MRAVHSQHRLGYAPSPCTYTKRTGTVFLESLTVYIRRKRGIGRRCVGKYKLDTER